jgi:hypothetical protein
VTNVQRAEFVRESAAVAMVGQESIILRISPSLPVKAFSKFIACRWQIQCKTLASNAQEPHPPGKPLPVG